MASYTIRKNIHYYIKYRENGNRKSKYAGRVYDKTTKKGIKLDDVKKMVAHYSAIERNYDNNFIVTDIQKDILSAIDQFLNDCLLVGSKKGILACNTLKNYKNHCERLKNWFQDIKVLQFKNLKILHVRKFESDIQHLAHKTRHERQKYLFKFLKWCGKMGYWKLSIQLQDVPRIKKPKTKVRYLEIKELEKLFSCAKYQKNAIKFIYYTGCRVSDVGFVRWNDYNSANQTLTFTVNDGSKTKHEETVPVLPIVGEIIEDQRKRNIYKSEFIFWNRNKKRLTGKNLYEIIDRVFKAAKIEHSSHVLRHTFATQMLRNGATIEEIKDLLRHTDIKDTMIYAHFAEQMQRNALNHLPIIKDVSENENIIEFKKGKVA